MEKHAEITRGRLRAFLSESQLQGQIYSKRAPVELAVYSAVDRVPYSYAVDQEFRPCKVGESFGPPWSTHWFRVSIAVPDDWRGQEVHLLWNTHSEGCVWIDGQPRQGLTGGGIRHEYRLVRQAKGGERMVIYIEMACNHLLGVRDSDKLRVGQLDQAEIATFNANAWDLYWDFRVIVDMACELPANSPRAGQALQVANAMVNQCRLSQPSTWKACRQMAANFLGERNGDGQHNLSAIGHAHIDTAWLWPLAESKRKCVRTFTTALRYMEEYPEYLFVCSQAQQLDWMKREYPTLYRRIKKRVKDGRFVPAGGSWVEPDCNIPSGESLVRQFLYGQRFFMREFGIHCQEFWNPDVFGYSGALPQIMNGVGIKRFLTQKLSWNQFNKPASHTFLWEGIDGSQVLTHFPPADTYNALADVATVVRNVNDFRDPERARESYMLFGYGDGGGGPTRGMLEQIRRMGDVDGLPRVEMRTPEAFFDRCTADATDPTRWVGELYFEYHRGTYTTQARNKRDNRRCELLLRDLEFLAAVGHAKRQLRYPAADIEDMWKTVLLNQFHDILPGSSIAEVYADSDEQYDDVIAHGSRLRTQALSVVIPEIGTKTSAREFGESCERVVAVNTVGEARREVVVLPQHVAAHTQATIHGEQLGIVSAPAFGYAVAVPEYRPNVPVRVVSKGNSLTLENEFIRARFSRGGRLTSLFDKTLKREAVPKGESGNQFVLYDDEPLNYDAWDVDIYHLEKFDVADDAHTHAVVEHGPLRGKLRFDYALSEHSTLRQWVSLTATAKQLEFRTQVDWHERHRFLKVKFPFDIRASQATYEIQFGHLQRPTHFNTSWDLARFEVCAHKWADLSEHGFGVALLNDSKYGYSVRDHEMHLSLLRAPVNPDPQADIGEHEFRYALMPHNGDLRSAGVIAAALRFNTPMHLSPAIGKTEQHSFFKSSNPAVVIDTIKKAEDSNALIVRLYEAYGSHASADITTTLPVTGAAACDLLEEDIGDVEWRGSKCRVSMRPFELQTLKLLLSR